MRDRGNPEEKRNRGKTDNPPFKEEQGKTFKSVGWDFCTFLVPSVGTFWLVLMSIVVETGTTPSYDASIWEALKSYFFPGMFLFLAIAIPASMCAGSIVDMLKNNSLADGSSSGKTESYFSTTGTRGWLNRFFFTIFHPLVFVFLVGVDVFINGFFLNDKFNEFLPLLVSSFLFLSFVGLLLDGLRWLLRIFWKKIIED